MTVGSLAVASAAAPVFVAAATSAADPEVTAAPPCLAWFGNIEDGQCLSYSNGQPVVGGTPRIGVGGPGSGSSGVTTGPMLPGSTITQPVG